MPETYEQVEKERDARGIELSLLRTENTELKDRNKMLEDLHRDFIKTREDTNIECHEELLKDWEILEGYFGGGFDPTKIINECEELKRLTTELEAQIQESGGTKTMQSCARCQHPFMPNMLKDGKCGPCGEVVKLRAMLAVCAIGHKPIKEGVEALFKAVQSGVYDTRSVVGDRVLLMKAAMKNIDALHIIDALKETKL